MLLIIIKVNVNIVTTSTSKRRITNVVPLFSMYDVYKCNKYNLLSTSTEEQVFIKIIQNRTWKNLTLTYKLDHCEHCCLTKRTSVFKNVIYVPANFIFPAVQWWKSIENSSRFTLLTSDQSWNSWTVIYHLPHVLNVHTILNVCCMTVWKFFIF